MEEGKDFKKDYIDNLMQTYFPEISSLEDSTQTVIQTIFEWSLSNFEKRLKLYCSAAPRHDEEELRRYMQTSDIQENYLMQIFKGRQINGTGAVHTQYTNSPPRSQPVQPANLPPNHVLQPHANGPMIGRHQGHTHVIPAFNHANQLINVVPNRQAPMVFPQKVIPKESLTASILAKVSPREQKEMLGEALYPRIQKMYPELAGKITGMLLEIENTELLHMLESKDALKSKVEEGVAVLKAHQAKEAAAAIRKE